MSMISEQIKELKDLRFRMGTSSKHNDTDWKIVDNAIDIIETLSAKVADENMKQAGRRHYSMHN